MDILLKERAYTSPKPVESFVAVSSEIFELTNTLISANFNLSSQPWKVQEKFTESKIQDLKTRLVKAYLLLKEYLVSSNIALKGSIRQYNNVLLKTQEFKEKHTKITSEVKQQIEEMLTLVEENNTKIKEIAEYLEKTSPKKVSELVLDKDQLSAIFDGDIDQVHNIFTKLPPSVFSGSLEDEQIKLKLGQNYSFEALLQMNKLQKMQMEIARESIAENKRVWTEMSTRIQTLADGLVDGLSKN